MCLSLHSRPLSSSGADCRLTVQHPWASALAAVASRWRMWRAQTRWTAVSDSFGRVFRRGATLGLGTHFIALSYACSSGCREHGCGGGWAAAAAVATVVAPAVTILAFASLTIAILVVSWARLGYWARRCHCRHLHGDDLLLIFSRLLRSFFFLLPLTTLCCSLLHLKDINGKALWED